MSVPGWVQRLEREQARSAHKKRRKLKSHRHHMKKVAAEHMRVKGAPKGPLG